MTIAKGVAEPTGPAEVREGATISALYTEMWLTGDDAVQGSAIVILEKVNGDNTVLVAAGQMAALNLYTNKKNIFHTQMGLLPSNTQYPMAIIKGWIKIPRSKQRFSLNDRLIMTIFAQSDGINGCGFFLYKEQY